MENIEQMVDGVVEHLGSVAQSGVVGGQPIEVGGVTLVVLSAVSVNLAAGTGGGEGRAASGGKGSAEPGGGLAEGAGGAARVRPAALITFTPQGVQVLTIPDQPGVFDKVMERVPQVVDMVEKMQHKLGLGD